MTTDNENKYRYQMDDNTYYYKVIRALVLCFLGFCAVVASCNYGDQKIRTSSPGYRYHEVQVRLDDDNGQYDSKVIKGVP